MPCFHPLTAWKSRDLDDYNKETGKGKMVFNPSLGFPNTRMELPCGQCVGCRLDRARSWAIRIMHEAKLHEQNCFVTLTYAEHLLPDNGSLCKRDMVLFMKRLRRRHPDINIRFFQCGEYGELLERPHHHLILFNFDFSDKKPFKRKNGNQLYISEELSELWPHGLHSIGELTLDSAMYTAKYVLKKINGENKDEHYNGKAPEYTTMSRRPGIGKEWFDKFKMDLYNHDKCVVSPSFIARPPKYYDRLYDLQQPGHFAQIKRKRVEAAKLNPENDSQRREVKEALAKIKIKRKERELEQAKKGIELRCAAADPGRDPNLHPRTTRKDEGGSRHGTGIGIDIPVPGSRE